MLKTSTNNFTGTKVFLLEKLKRITLFLLPYPADSRQHDLNRKIWRGFFYFLAGIVFFFMGVKYNLFYLYGQMPSIAQLENPKMPVSSEIYTSDKVLIGKYFTENRTPVTYEEISPLLLKALIATEDIRFYEHSGIDPEALLSIAWYLVRGENRGGSTITQQLAKNLYKTRHGHSQGLLSNVPGLRTVIIKSKEWITAVNLERTFTKEEILTLYLNTVDFGSNSFGIKIASETFFNATPSTLNIQEAATLVGLLKAPTYYSPILNPKNAARRRNVVLSQMVKNRDLSKNEFDSLKKLPLELKLNQKNHYEGSGTYFRGVMNNYLNEWCENNGYDLYTDGLKIYTTIDSKMQEYAEKSVQEHMVKLQKRFYKHWEGKNPWVDENGKELPGFIESILYKTDYYKYLVKKYNNHQDSITKQINRKREMKVFTWEGEKDTVLTPLDSIAYYKHFLHAGFMSMDPHTGHIKAWVGGINYKYFKYDHVKQSKRQPGSTFKPFVYAAAFEEGYSPCDKLPDRPITVVYEENGEEKTWSPHNSDWKYSYDTLTLRKAMARSINSVTARLTEKLGPQKVVETAAKLGIKSPLETVPSIGLGSSDVSVYEMVGAYSAMINKGEWIEPIFITRIEDARGNLIHEFVPERKRAISEENAFLMVHMLKGGLEEAGGTSQALFEFDIFKGNEMGGKTGTTSNYSDGWFIGVTKDLVGGVWVGGEHRSIHFRTSQLGEGAKTALPVFGLFMEKVYKDKSLGIKMGYFPKPAVKISKKYNCPTLQRPKLDTLALPQLSPIAPI